MVNIPMTSQTYLRVTDSVGKYTQKFAFSRDRHYQNILRGLIDQVKKNVRSKVYSKVKGQTLHQGYQCCLLEAKMTKFGVLKKL